MRKANWFVLMLLAVALVASSVAATRPVRAAESSPTEVYIRAEFLIPAVKRGDSSNIRRETMFRAQFRVARADMSSVDITMDEEELKVKARKVTDPEDFKTFLTRQGVWKVLDESGKDIFTLKSVRKTSVDKDGDALAVLVSTRQLSGAAKGAAAGTTLPVKLVLDGEETPMTLKIASDGTTAILTMPELTEARAWQLRSLISLAPYPCTLNVTDFRYGDDLLRQILGW